MFLLRQFKKKRSRLVKSFKLFVAATFLMNQFAVFAMESPNYTISKMTANYGSGYRISTSYQIPADSISQTPIGISFSDNYSLTGQSAVPLEHTMAGIFINDDNEFTSSMAVELSLLCSDPSGCDYMSLSDNGVSWSTPQPYSTTTPYDLIDIDGERQVFAKFQNGQGEWSGVCQDSITLDREAPQTTISPVSGIYMEDPSIVLTASEPSTIYYTVDGSDPTIESSVYTSPIILNEDATLKGFAEDEAGNTGSVISESYTVCNGTGLSISGVVKDATVDKTMPLVVITLNTGQQATTNINGGYSFSSLPRGYYRIESITAPTEGYVTYQKDLTLCKENLSHDIILTKKDSLFGGDTFSGYSADSVNTGTGNFTYSETDLAISGKGFSLTFARSYNSQDEKNGPLGFGWTHNYNIGLSIERDDEDAITSVTARWGDGKAETWVPNGTGGYDPMPGVYDTLIENPDHTFTIKKKDLIEYHFDASNRLTAIRDESNNALTFAYAGDLLGSIVDTAGRSVTFSYDVESRITRILDPLDRSVTYTYDVNGNLAASTDRNGHTTTYTYDVNHQMLTVTDPLGNIAITNNYDEQRRVVASQRDALGAESLYSYDVADRTTQIVDPYGNISYHRFDDLLRLIEEVDALGHSATYEYNARGSLKKVTDKNGNQTAYQYDDNGNVLVKTDALSHTSIGTYDANNNPLIKTDARGNTTSFVYDAGANLLSVTDSLGNANSYTYDASGQLLTTTDALGNMSTNEYDHYGNRTAVTDAQGSRSTFTFDIVGRKLSEIHPLGRALAYEYDDMDNLIRVTDALGGISVFTYDANGNKVGHVDANGNTTTFTYDAKNRLTDRTTALNRTESYAYDLLDRRTAVTNPRGFISSIVYNAVGNVINEIDASGDRVQYAYDANGNRLSTTDANGNQTVFAHDALNRLVSTTDSLGNTTTFAYDPNGNRLSTTDALGHSTTYTYDVLNRLLTVTDPLGHTTTNAYDALGRLITVTDPKERQNTFEYDSLNRLVRVVDSAAGEVTAAYDAIGNRTSIADTRGNTTTYDYNVLNRLIAETDPLGNIVSMAYDAVGNPIALTNADGTITYTYDTDNRLITITYPDATSGSYAYDANNNRLNLVDSMGTTAYTYTAKDQIASVTNSFGLTVQYNYDPNGNRSTIKYPGNKTVVYFFDTLNRLSGVRDWDWVDTGYQYDAAGRLIAQTRGNGSTVTYTFDAANRMIGKEDRAPGGELIAGYAFTLDEVGNHTSMSMDQPLIPQIGAMDENFNHDAANQLVSSNGTIYSYDGRGNRTQAVDPTTTTQYAYDYNNRLTQVSNGINVDEYRYNSDGHRLVSVADGVETRYLLDVNGGMENVLATIDGSNTVQSYFVYGDGLLYSINAATHERLYYHYDTTGSTVAISDASGNVTDKYAYLPFGELSNSEAMHDNPFTYVGKYGVMQEDNGLYFMRARFYDPETRRFMGRDPIKGEMNNPQTLSPYIYTKDNPIVAIDPKGEIALVAITGFLVVYVMPVVIPIIIEHIPILVAEVTWKVIDKLKPRDPGRIIEDGGQDILNHDPIFDNPLLPSNKCIDPNPNQCVDPSIGNPTNSLPDAGENVINNTNDFQLGTPNTMVTPDDGKKPPKEYLNVGAHASRYYRKEFAKLRDPDLLNKQTRSHIEWRVAAEINALQQKRNQYGYRSTKEEEKKRAQLRSDIRNSGRGFYANLTKTLSKYAVLVGNLNKMPDFNSSNINRRGVYAN